MAETPGERGVLAQGDLRALVIRIENGTLLRSLPKYFQLGPLSCCRMSSQPQGWWYREPVAALYPSVLLIAPIGIVRVLNEARRELLG